MAETRSTGRVDDQTLEEALRQYAPRVYNLARRMLGNEADAEDVTQEVLLHVVRNLPTFRGEAAFSTWLHRITVNAALDYRRRRATREKHRAPKPIEELPEEGVSVGPVRRWAIRPEQQAVDHETQKLIEDAITRLSEKYRDVYVLADVEGLSNEEIASLLGLRLPAVKSRLHRARLMMRDALAPYFEEKA
jgi:RNA polymerase sigma-70 factor (ECF subfamily)